MQWDSIVDHTIDFILVWTFRPTSSPEAPLCYFTIKTFTSPEGTSLRTLPEQPNMTSTTTTSSVIKMLLSNTTYLDIPNVTLVYNNNSITKPNDID